MHSYGARRHLQRIGILLLRTAFPQEQAFLGTPHYNCSTKHLFNRPSSLFAIIIIIIIVIILLLFPFLLLLLEASFPETFRTYFRYPSVARILRTRCVLGVLYGRVHSWWWIDIVGWEEHGNGVEGCMLYWERWNREPSSIILAWRFVRAACK